MLTTFLLGNIGVKKGVKVIYKITTKDRNSLKGVNDEHRKMV